MEQGVPANHIIRLDLDSIENKQYTEPMALFEYVMKHVVDDEKHYVLLDEIQKVDDSSRNHFLQRWFAY